MNHQQYQSLMDSALHSAWDRGDYKAIAAVSEGGDQLYLSQDWSNWDETERVVFGMIMGLRIMSTDRMSVADVRGTALYKTAEEMLDPSAVENILFQVFGE